MNMSLHLQRRRVSQATNRCEAGNNLLGSFFDPEDNGEMFLPNIGLLSTGSSCYPLHFGFCLPYSSTLKVEAACSSEMWVVFQQTTLRYFPGDRTFHVHIIFIIYAYKYHEDFSLYTKKKITVLQWYLITCFSRSRMMLEGSLEYFWDRNCACSLQD
jgi:hypothetical protein